MPKEHFDTLKQAKKDKVLAGATAEFSEYLLKDSSIVRITKRIGISRGSFYNYFHDIDDLYDYVLTENHMTFFMRLVNNVKDCDGNMRIGFAKTMDELVDLFKLGENSLIRNMFLNIDLSRIFSRSETHNDEIRRQQIEHLSTVINRDLYKLDDREFIDYLDMLYILMLNHIIKYLRDFTDYETLMIDFNRKLKLIDSIAIK